MNQAGALSTIALVGNPNCGKTALFNLLTGSRQKVANYAGVTVERKQGEFTTPSGRRLRIFDLPGAYSLKPRSPDENVTYEVCLGLRQGEVAPDLLVCVVDATNLRLHLRFVLELRALGRPMVVVLNLIDTAKSRGIRIDRGLLSRELGLPVVETVAIARRGAQELIEWLDRQAPAHAQASATSDLATSTSLAAVNAAKDASAADLHAEVRRLLSVCVKVPRRTALIDDRLDRILLHPVWGLALLTVLLFVMFQAVFSWAKPLQALILQVLGLGSDFINAHMAAGPLRSLLVDGIIAGSGSVLVFLPQILILFFFILSLEESGYLPRAAFLLDGLMVKAGLSGRSFIPLLSSFACAIPGIMATRSIQDPRHRLATILVAPLMTCSARLPVYALLIGAFIPQRAVLGWLNLQGLVLFGLYAAGIVSALAVAFVLKLWRGKAEEPALLLELPSYRLPHARDLLLGLRERAVIFLNRVGTIILSLTIVLWGLSSFPGAPAGASHPDIYYSFAGMLGRALETVFSPIGFNWQICIALVPGMAAREVAVSALATVYALQTTGTAASSQLAPILSAQWGLPTALSLLAWYVYAPQCISTLAVIRRETLSWRAVAVSAGYLFALAYAAAFITYQLARLMS